LDSRIILSKLPYSKPFLFVDKILEVDGNSITGEFTFSPDLDFYKGHFEGNPVTPGVILTECMAQIGVVCLGIYLLTASALKLSNFTPEFLISSKASSISGISLRLSR